MNAILNPIKLSLVLLACLVPFAYGDPIKAPTIPIEHWTLSNGIQVYFVPSPQLPIVDITVMVDAGSNRDKAQPGIANMTMAMIGEGTSTMDTDTIAEQFDNVGALFSSGTQQDQSMFNLRSLSDKRYLNPALRTFSAILLDPELSPKSFTRIKSHIVQSIQQQQQSSHSVATQAFYKHLFKNTPYSHQPLGAVATVNSLQFSDLLNFYNRFYVGKNITLVMVGDLSKKRAHSLSQALLGSLTAGEKAAPLPPIQSTGRGHLVHISFPATQTTIRMGQLGIAPHDPDYYALQVGNYIFGGGLLVSRLFNEVRERRGLSYSIGSHFRILKERGPFVIGLQTRNDKAPEAVKVVKNTLQHFIAKGPTDEEMDAAKYHLISAFPLSLKSNSDILDKVATIAFYQLPLDFLSSYQQHIHDVTKETALNAFKRHVIPSQLITVMVGPSSSAPTHHG